MVVVVVVGVVGVVVVVVVVVVVGPDRFENFAGIVDSTNM